jgi:hypothetical protein
VAVLAGVVYYAFASQVPMSFLAEYLREVGKRMEPAVSPPPVTEADHEPSPFNGISGCRDPWAGRERITSARRGGRGFAPLLETMLAIEPIWMSLYAV